MLETILNTNTDQDQPAVPAVENDSQHTAPAQQKVADSNADPTKAFFLRASKGIEFGPSKKDILCFTNQLARGRNYVP